MKLSSLLLALHGAVAAAISPENFALIASSQDDQDLNLRFVGLADGRLALSGELATQFVFDTGRGYFQTYDVVTDKFFVDSLHGFLITSRGQFVQRRGKKLLTNPKRGSAGFAIDKTTGTLLLGGNKTFVACPTEQNGAYTVESGANRPTCRNGKYIELKYARVN